MSKKENYENSQAKSENNNTDQNLKPAAATDFSFTFISLEEARQLGAEICEKYHKAFELLRDK